MSKKIVIIESDASFSQRLRGELEAKGFSIQETPDGKVAVELVRKEKPDLVVLSVELAAGQSGYIVCGKLKKDDELKKIPIVIIGKDADGFEAHKRLKARAEDYLKKPFDPPAILEKIKPLIGLPEPESDDLVLDADEALGLESLGEDEPLVEPEAAAGETRGGDPDLDMLDAAFDGISEPAAEEPKPEEEPVEAPPDDGLLETAPVVEEEALEALDTSAEAALDALGADEPLVEEAALEPLEEPQQDAEAALDALDALGEIETKPVEDEISLETIETIEEPPAPPPPARPARHTPAPIPALADDGELRALREKVAELEARVRDLDDQLTSKTNELDAVKTTSGGKDKEYFSLKEQSTKKDKEIVRLKQDLNEKEQEVIDLREKENHLEQQVSELTAETAKREAQIKTLAHRSEAFAADRKKLETAVTAAKDEVRQLSAKLATAQGELDQAQDAMAEVQKEAVAARAEANAGKEHAEQLKVELTAAQSDLGTVRGELETAKGELEGVRGELDQAKAAQEKLGLELEAAKEENERLKPEADRAATLEEESTGLRARISELEEAAGKNEERVVKAYQKIKADEKAREKTKKAIAVALQILDEAAAVPEDGAAGNGDEATPG